MFFLILNLDFTCYTLMLPLGKRRMLTASNSPMKHTGLISALSEAVPLLAQVSVIHWRDHCKTDPLYAKEVTKVMERQNVQLSHESLTEPRPE